MGVRSGGRERGFTSHASQSMEALGGRDREMIYLINVSRYYSGCCVKGEQFYRSESGSSRSGRRFVCGLHGRWWWL